MSKCIQAKWGVHHTAYQTSNFKNCYAEQVNRLHWKVLEGFPPHRLCSGNGEDFTELALLILGGRIVRILTQGRGIPAHITKTVKIIGNLRYRRGDDRLGAFCQLIWLCLYARGKIHVLDPVKPIAIRLAIVNITAVLCGRRCQDKTYQEHA